MKKNKHLPWMTSAKVEEEENDKAVNMTRMSFETVEIVENLQLQIIALSNVVKEYNAVIEAQEKRISVLEKMNGQFIGKKTF